MAKDIEVKVIAPFEIDPLHVAIALYSAAPAWRWLRRRRLHREIVRLS